MSVSGLMPGMSGNLRTTVRIRLGQLIFASISFARCAVNASGM